MKFVYHILCKYLHTGHKCGQTIGDTLAYVLRLSHFYSDLLRTI